MCLPVVRFNLYCFINKNYSFILNVVVDVAVILSVSTIQVHYAVCLTGGGMRIRIGNCQFTEVTFHNYKPIGTALSPRSITRNSMESDQGCTSRI